ncbi:MAG: hypothetical protein ABSA26_00065 [Thermoguttaceae bacterium]|jgi:hypothetical protein
MIIYIKKIFFLILFVLLLGLSFVPLYFLTLLLKSSQPPSSTPNDYYTAIGELLLVVVIGLEGVIAFCHLSQARKDAQETTYAHIKEATDSIFQIWWSDGLNKLRKYFYKEFLPKYLVKLKDASLKEVEIIVEEDKGRARKICYFFDRVGWLGAAGLIDVDYVLGPMQHTLRRVWYTMQPFIKKERDRKNSTTEWLDPVYQLGFEWLFNRSDKPANHQSSLLAKRFAKPELLSTEIIEQMHKDIDEDEDKFKEYLKKLRDMQMMQDKSYENNTIYYANMHRPVY